MIGQVQLVNVPNPYAAKMEILRNKEEILAAANERDPVLVNLGEVRRTLEARVIETELGKMLITHLIVDCQGRYGG
jgi:hydroxymethylglutaryl-CoA reductase